VLAAKRLRKRAALFAALAGVSLVVSGLGVGLNGFIANAETAGVRDELASRAGADLSLEASLALDAQPAEQDAQMRALIARQLPASMTVTRMVTSKLPVRNSDERPLVLFSIADLASVATLVDGAWPTSPAEVAVHADAAAALGVHVGSPMQLGPVTVTVAATWRPIDPLAGRWVADPLVANGMDGNDIGPVVIDESVWSELTASPRVRWAITADRTAIGPDDLERIQTNWESLPDTIRAEDTVFDVSFERRGRLAAVAGEILSRIEALRAVVPVAMLTIGAIALLTVIELARLLATVRGTENRLFWARGSTARDLATGVAGETALVTLPAAAGGVALASGALIAVLGDTDAAARVPEWTWGAPLLVAAVITAVTAATTWIAGRALENRDPSARSTRPRQLVGVGALVLVVLAAALSTWQLLLYGSPITLSATGHAQIDPVAVASPALLLVGTVLVALAGLTALAPAIQRRTERARGILAVLVSRTMLRRLRLTVIPLVLCALVGGQFLIAASYSATWDSSFTQSRELRTGSTLSLSGGRLDEAVIEHASAVPGVTAVAPIIVQNTLIGTQQASLVAATPAAVRSLAAQGNGLVDAALIADAMTAAPVGSPITADLLSFDITLTGFVEPPVIDALLSDEVGGLHTVRLQAEQDDAPFTGEAHAGWTLIGFDVDAPDASPAEELRSIEITGGTIDLVLPWSAFALGGYTWELQRLGSSPGSSVGFELNTGGVTRIVAGASSEPIVPVVVSQLFADGAGVRVGDTLPIVVDSQQDTVIAQVAAIVPAVPGAEREFAALIDLATLRRVELRLFTSHPLATQAWVGSANPNATAESLRTQLPARVIVTSLDNDQARSILGSAAVALWIGAVGAAVLAVLALVTVVEAQLGSRRGEVMLLRTLGVDAATTSRARRHELGIAAVAGLVVGLIAGTVVTVLTVPALAGAAVPDRFVGVPTVPSIALVPLGIGLGAFAVCVIAIVIAYGAAVARQARRASPREEAAE
jgi:hypothetical protein